MLEINLSVGSDVFRAELIILGESLFQCIIVSGMKLNLYASVRAYIVLNGRGWPDFDVRDGLIRMSSGMQALLYSPLNNTISLFCFLLSVNDCSFSCFRILLIELGS